MKLNRTPNELDRNARNKENDNWVIIEGAVKEVKNVVDDFIGTVSDEVINELIDNAQFNWQEFVDSYEDLSTNAKNGDTVITRDDGKVYRFDGSKWVLIQQIDINAVNEIEQRLDSKFTQKYDEVKQMMRKVTVEDLPEQGIVSAHRGGGDYKYSPVGADNGFSGFDNALRLGAHIIDVDVRRTGDGTFVAMHDTSVARTTDGRGFVTSLVASALPNIDIKEVMGSGWEKEPIPTVEEILQKYGGRVIITIEPKEGMSAIKPLADLIKAYKLEKSVFINTKDFDVAGEIVAQGCLAHVYGCDTISKVQQADNVGAWLVEVPHNASREIIDAVLSASNIKRVVAKPIWARKQINEMTTGIQGHVSDAMGYTNTKRKLVDTIKGSLLSNKRGIGWRFEGDWEIKDNKLTYVDYVNEKGASVFLGDLSTDNPPLSYTITFKVIFSDKGSSSAGARLRVCATNDDGKSFDNDTTGYVCNLRKNGQINLWTSSSNFGDGILLGETDVEDPRTTKIEEGQECELVVNVTPTSISMTRVDTNQTIGPYSNTDWRGGNIYAWFTRGNMGASFTDVRIEES